MTYVFTILYRDWPIWLLWGRSGYWDFLEVHPRP